MNAIFEALSFVDSLFWGYFAFALIFFLGLWMTLGARFFQLRALPSAVGTFKNCLLKSSGESRGVHPLKAFFASVGGMIGIGNVVGIVTAVQIGGPGALFWVWVAAMIGMIIKYSEIYLGLKHRVPNDRGGYDGGPMYFLQKAFKSRLIPIFVCTLLCIYGVEIYQFSVIADSVSSNFSLNKYLVISILLPLVIFASVGGVKRIGQICSLIMPFFVILYVSMGLWVVIQEFSTIPAILKSVFISAFTGHAAIGGFAGSSVLLAIQHGISRAAYSADIGIGYDSIIQSESNVVEPATQGRLAILGVCIDNLVCTMSILIVLTTGIWKSTSPIEASLLVQTALGNYFPFMNLFMPLFLFIVGYSTMIAYFCVGIKCARFLSPEYGLRLYVAYGVSALVFFSFFDQSHALLVMSLAGAMLLLTNLIGIFKLRGDVDFEIAPNLVLKPSDSASLSACAESQL